MNEPRDLRLPRRFQHPPRTLDIGTYEVSGVLDTQVDMTFGGHVHDRVNAADRVHNCRVADVLANEVEPGIVERALEISEIAGVGELVQDDKFVIRVLAQDVMREIGADKPRATGEEDLHLIYRPPFSKN